MHSHETQPHVLKYNSTIWQKITGAFVVNISAFWISYTRNIAHFKQGDNTKTVF